MMTVSLLTRQSPRFKICAYDGIKWIIFFQIRMDFLIKPIFVKKIHSNDFYSRGLK